jgi:hypothetical protein
LVSEWLSIAAIVATDSPASSVTVRTAVVHFL